MHVHQGRRKGVTGVMASPVWGRRGRGILRDWSLAAGGVAAVEGGRQAGRELKPLRPKQLSEIPRGLPHRGVKSRGRVREGEWAAGLGRLLALAK
jgi:hypothetical protein